MELHSEEDIKVLNLIKQIRSLDLPLSEVRRVVDLCRNSGCMHAYSYLESRIPDYLKNIETRLQELESLKVNLFSLSKNLKRLKQSGQECNGDCVLKGGED